MHNRNSFFIGEPQQYSFYKYCLNRFCNFNTIKNYYKNYCIVKFNLNLLNNKLFNAYNVFLCNVITFLIYTLSIYFNKLLYFYSNRKTFILCVFVNMLSSLLLLLFYSKTFLVCLHYLKRTIQYIYIKRNTPFSGKMLQSKS